MSEAITIACFIGSIGFCAMLVWLLYEVMEWER